MVERHSYQLVFDRSLVKHGVVHLKEAFPLQVAGRCGIPVMQDFGL